MDIDDLIKTCRKQQGIAGNADAAVLLEVDVELQPPAYGQQVALWEGGPKGDVIGYDYWKQRAQVVWAADEMIEGLEALQRSRVG